MYENIRLLTLAPSTSHPPMIGDAKRIFGLYSGMNSLGVRGTYAGKSFWIDHSGSLNLSAGNRSMELPRSLTGLIAIARRGHYNETKHCTSRWRSFVTPFLSDTQFNAVYCHFLFTWPTVSRLIGDRPVVIDTHNSEWQWYDSFARSTKNPLIKSVCAYSKKRATEILAELPANVIMAHVSEFDAQEYRHRRPDILHVVVPNGSDVAPRTQIPAYAGSRKRLLFFGSLHGKMSSDALEYFDRRFWPVLDQYCEMVVAGANPCKSIRAMCQRNHWELRPNIPEDQIDGLFNKTHFSVMPFSYGAGSKLKFFDAVGRGVPVLSTVAGVCGQVHDLPSFVTVSDDPAVWADKVASMAQLPEFWRDEASQFASRFSWSSVAREILPHIEARIR